MRKMMTLIIFLLSIFTILSSFVSTPYATPLISSTGLPNAPVIITFDELGALPQGTAITDQYASFGVAFAPSVYFNGQGPVPGIPGIGGNYVSNFYIDPPNYTFPTNNPFSIYFTFGTPQMEAAFGLATNPATTTLTALLNGTVVETFSLSTTSDNPATAFVGFTGILFNEITISTTDIYGYHFALVDTIQDCAVPVPEPATIFLLGGGLLGVGWLMRKRRA
jgi:hypothetical protein